MQKTILLSLLNLAFVGSASAQALIDNSPQAIAQFAQGFGTAQLVTTGAQPSIQGDVYNAKYRLTFYDCDAQQGCQYMVFSTRYPATSLNLEGINHWNQHMLYGRLFRKDNQLVLTMPVRTLGQVNALNLKTDFEIWASTVEQLEEMYLSRP
ncbi:hypothetical protein VQ643_02940 [Pseudomonas sp. F1_0610]|uniref:hypothetical protein n=1 Tax=Pseudomonas sp. F1_0610 TaxID=3114284 RepID=UPI0039C46D46